MDILLRLASGNFISEGCGGHSLKAVKTKSAESQNLRETHISAEIPKYPEFKLKSMKL